MGKSILMLSLFFSTVTYSKEVTLFSCDTSHGEVEVTAWTSDLVIKKPKGKVKLLGGYRIGLLNLEAFKLGESRVNYSLNSTRKTV